MGKLMDGWKAFVVDKDTKRHSDNIVDDIFIFLLCILLRELIDALCLSY